MMAPTTCKHERVMVVWSETMDLEEIWCGVCEQDVTKELEHEILQDALDENIAAMQHCGLVRGDVSLTKGA